jgi:hypothetical protein
MQRRIATKAADLGLFFPMLERLGECVPLEPDQRTQFNQFTRTGQAWYDAMIAAVHGGSSYGGALPLPQQLYSWQQTATSLTNDLASIDPRWYLEYWSGVFNSDYPVPQHLRRELRAAGLIG